MTTVTDLYRGFGSIFFDDQLMYSQDLNNIEYSKLKTFRDSLVSIIKQPGVAIDSLSELDLKVVYVDAKHFTVNSGSAIDKYGRLIYVPINPASGSGSVATDPYYHPVWPDRENIVHNQLPDELTTYYVNIYYDTQQDIAETDDKGVLHYTREYDSYNIVVENSNPTEDSGGLCLASFLVNSAGNIPGSGSITDQRSLLLLRAEANPSARELYRQTSAASNTVDADASDSVWTENGAGYVAKAATLYRYKGEETMNVNFCVPSGSGAGTLKVYIISDESGGTGNLPFSGSAGSYSFSFNINPILEEDIVYHVGVKLKSDDAGTAKVRDTIIDVV